MRKILLTLLASAPLLLAQEAPRVYTIQDLFTRNVGNTEQQNKQFPPHKIIGNVYYVGTESLSSFLITTPQGHILINSIYERNVPTIQDSVQKLGFKFEDIKILLGSHAHGDSSGRRRPGGEAHRRTGDGYGGGHTSVAGNAFARRNSPSFLRSAA
jgi:glyoxylase-like metal-dependent hydrolase (beta-lactamase superfamily II)